MEITPDRQLLAAAGKKEITSLIEEPKKINIDCVAGLAIWGKWSLSLSMLMQNWPEESD